jgi:3-phenylpropionate/trans-cinnamate dioxygenase ferredoxin subunit
VTEPTAVGRLADFPKGQARRVFVDGMAIAVVHAEEGVFAVADRCSHADVSLAEGEVDGCAIECWLHGSAFDLRTGAALSLPAFEPVATYRVTVDGDGDDAQILIDPTPRRGTEEA